MLVDCRARRWRAAREGLVESRSAIFGIVDREEEKGCR